MIREFLLNWSHLSLAIRLNQGRRKSRSFFSGCQAAKEWTEAQPLKVLLSHFYGALKTLLNRDGRCQERIEIFGAKKPIPEAKELQMATQTSLIKR